MLGGSALPRRISSRLHVQVANHATLPASTECALAEPCVDGDSVAAMTMRPTVFVCGTYSDLSEERGAILDAIQRLQLIHDSMEFFGARPERPIETCLAEVRKSNIMVVIVGRKYGSIVPGQGISYSEAEYREAQRLALPCLVYILKGESRATSQRSELERSALGEFERWKTELNEKHTTYEFRDSVDLALRVTADLGREIGKLENDASDIKSPIAANRTDLPYSSGIQPKLRFWERYGDEARQLLYGLAMDSEDNVIIAGSFWGKVSFGEAQLTSTGENLFVAKFNSAGKHLWSDRYGDPSEQVAIGVEVDDTGAILIASAFKGALGFGGGPLISEGRYKIGLAKLDRNGRHLWSHSFGGDSYAVPECFAVAPDGRLVVAGRFTGLINFGVAEIKCQSSQTDIFVASLSSDGDCLWAKRFGGPFEQQTRSIAIDGAGCIALAGVFKGSISFDSQQLVENEPGDYCGFITRLDENGSVRWCKRFGEPFAEQGSAVAFDRSNGDLIAAGFIRNKLPPQNSSAVQSLCLFTRYNSSGILQWSKSFGACAFPDTLSVVPGGEILLTGHFQLTVDFGLGPLESAGGYDIFSAMFASDGTPRWSRRFGDGRQQFLARGVHNTRGLVALAGSFHGTIDFGSGPLVASGYDGVNEGAEDIFLALFDTERLSPASLSLPPLKDRKLEIVSEEQKMSRIGRIVSGGLLSLFVALVLGALTVFGIINSNVGHLLLFLAFAVGSFLLSTDLMAGKSTKLKLLAVLGLLLFFIAADWEIQRLKKTQDSPPPQNTAIRPGVTTDAPGRDTPQLDSRTSSPLPDSRMSPPPETTSKVDETRASVSPVESLTNLGWTVNPGGANKALQFNDNYSHISMRKSAAYFCALKKDFMIVIVGAKDTDGASGLRNAEHLKKLEFDAPEFSNISELRDLRNLESLGISQTSTLSDISPLEGLTGLKELALGSAGIRDLSPIRGLHNLTSLQIAGTLVSDLSPITSLHSLRELNVTGSRVTNFSPITNITTLEKLSINGRQLPGLVILRNLSSFKTLSVFDNAAADLTPLEELGNLENLSIDVPLTLNLAPLRSLSKLSRLSVSCNAGDFTSILQLQDIAAVGELHELRTLNLLQVAVTDLSFMRGLPKLTDFSAVFTPISNISGIENATALVSVQLTRTNVVDVSPLLRLPNLADLHVEYTPARSDVLTELERRGIKVHR